MTTDTESCPTCNGPMRYKGVSADIDHRGSVISVDISQWECDNCRTLVLDDGSVLTGMDRDHLKALQGREYHRRE